MNVSDFRKAMIEKGYSSGTGTTTNKKGSPKQEEANSMKLMEVKAQLDLISGMLRKLPKARGRAQFGELVRELKEKEARQVCSEDMALGVLDDAKKLISYIEKELAQAYFSSKLQSRPHSPQHRD